MRLWSLSHKLVRDPDSTVVSVDVLLLVDDVAGGMDIPGTLDVPAVIEETVC